MNESEIKVFISGVRRYFESIEPNATVVIEPPFIKDNGRPFLEYTGIIAIFGKARGAVCFTANEPMLRQILRLLEEDLADKEALCDLVGEIANTLSGNAREEFGRDFMISVPIVSVGGDVKYPFPAGTRNYVIPIIWHSETAYLLICLI